MKEKLQKFWFIIPALHFLASFFYERSILLFDKSAGDIVAAISMGGISDTGERVIGYLISKIFAAGMIYLLWKLIFRLFRQGCQEKSLLLFAGIWAVGALLLFLIWPGIFTVSNDNPITYSYAIRLFPEYWHSAYTSCLYCACMMIVPHPMMISLMQWTGVVCCAGYFFRRIEKSERLKGRGRFAVFGVFLLPQTIYLFYDSYRTEIYATLCLFFAALLAMDAVDRKERSMKEMIGIGALAAFVAVWRTEGIILGVLGYGCGMLFIYRKTWKKFFLQGLILVLFFGLFSVPQKLGDSKYYGKDYSFINTFAVLRNILGSADANLSYEGAGEDLAAIEAITPIPQIKTYGLQGYRNYNVACGRKDINQSMADASTGKAYMKAYYRLVLHNPKIYILTQGTTFSTILHITDAPYTKYCDIAPEDDLPYWTYDAEQRGLEDIDKYRSTDSATRSFHDTVYSKVTNVVNGIENAVYRIYLYALILLAVPVLQIVIVLREFIALCKKKKARIAELFFGLIMLAQFAGIVVVMPTYTIRYFQAYYLASFAFLLVYGLAYLGKKKAGADALQNI